MEKVKEQIEFGRSFDKGLHEFGMELKFLEGMDFKFFTEKDYKRCKIIMFKRYIMMVEIAPDFEPADSLICGSNKSEEKLYYLGHLSLRDSLSIDMTKDKHGNYIVGIMLYDNDGGRLIENKSVQIRFKKSKERAMQRFRDVIDTNIYNATKPVRI